MEHRLLVALTVTLKQIWRKDVQRIHQAQDRDQWLALVKMEMNYGVSYKLGIPLSTNKQFIKFFSCTLSVV
jgi:hypothetical protein